MTTASDVVRRPSTFLQEEWVLSLDTPWCNHNLLIVVEIRGAMDRGALREALTLLTARHEALRTAFAIDDGRVWQIIRSSLEPPLEVTDVSNVGAAGCEKALAAQIVATGDARLDMRGGPLWRALLTQLGSATHVLTVAASHIVFDDTSRGLFVRDLAGLYSALVDRAEPALPKIAMQLGDFAEWERAQVLPSEAERFWAAALAARAPRLPLDEGTRDRADGMVAWSIGTLDVTQVSAASAVAQAAGATLGSALRALVVASLAPYLGEAAVLGASLGNRRERERQDVIGLLAGFLPVRADLAGDPGFATLVQRLNRAERDSKRYVAPMGTIVAACGDSAESREDRVFDLVINYMPDSPASRPVTTPLPGGGELLARKPPERRLSPVLGRPFSAVPKLGYQLHGRADGGVDVELLGKRSQCSPAALANLSDRFWMTTKRALADPAQGLAGEGR